MARYVDADKLISDGWRLERQASNGKILTVMSIADVPTADVVEVVRCKDCKYNEPLNANVHCKGYCNYVEDLSDIVRPSDYCSYGEMKGGKR